MGRKKYGLSESWVSGLLLLTLTVLVLVHDLEFCYAQTVKDWIQSQQSRPRTPARSIRPIGSLSSIGGSSGGGPISITPQVNTRLKPLVFPYHPDAVKSPLEIIAQHGYKGENHLVVTPDGYILSVFHIFPNTSSDKFRGPIFLQHGLISSGMEYLLNSKEHLMSFALSDAGYDVWIGNSRGTTYSRGHVNMSNIDAAYWEFSVNEMGKYDLPSQIDYVLAKTGHEKVYYVGMSMGTTQLWVMMSHHPHMNEKVKVMVALAPVAYLKHSTTILRLFTHLEGVHQLRYAINFIFQGEFFPFGITPLINMFGSELCYGPPPAQTICQVLLHFGAGYSRETDGDALKRGIGHVPASTSFRTMMHMVQFFKPSLFREYDYGTPGKNWKVYGRKTPPPYSLNKTTIPCAIFYGYSDYFVNQIDAERVAKELPNTIFLGPIDAKYFNHGDFHIAKKGKVLVVDPVMKILEKY